MGVEAHWDFRAEDIVYMILHPNWAWAELYRQLQDLQHGSPANPVAAIIDMSQGADVPGGSIFLPDNLRHIENLLACNRKRRFPVVLVGANTSHRMTFDSLRMMDQRIGWRVYFTDTVDEARDYLTQHCFSASTAS